MMKSRTEIIPVPPGWDRRARELWVAKRAREAVAQVLASIQRVNHGNPALALQGVLPLPDGDGLTSSPYRLERYDEAQDAGTRALETKDRRCGKAAAMGWTAWNARWHPTQNGRGSTYLFSTYAGASRA